MWVILLHWQGIDICSQGNTHVLALRLTFAFEIYDQARANNFFDDFLWNLEIYIQVVIDPLLSFELFPGRFWKLVHCMPEFFEVIEVEQRARVQFFGRLHFEVML